MVVKTDKVVNLLHPLEPLSALEIELAVEIVKREKSLTSKARFASIVLEEPAKDLVLNFKSGDVFNREAALIILEPATDETYEVTVSLTEDKVTRFELIEGVRPGFMLDGIILWSVKIPARPRPTSTEQ